MLKIFLSRVINYLFSLFKREKFLPRPNQQNSWRYDIAAHESGHCIVAWYSSYISRVEEISTKETKDALGKVTLIIINDNLWTNLVITLAGISAEMLINKKSTTSGRKENLLKAKYIAEKISSTTPPWKINYKISKLPFDKLFLQSPSAKTQEILCHGYSAAKFLIQNHQEKFLKLVDKLMEKEILNEQEIEKILGSRIFVKTLRIFDKYFYEN